MEYLVLTGNTMKQDAKSLVRSQKLAERRKFFDNYRAIRDDISALNRAAVSLNIRMKFHLDIEKVQRDEQ